jgi:hypothetical protein
VCVLCVQDFEFIWFLRASQLGIYFVQVVGRSVKVCTEHLIHQLVELGFISDVPPRRLQKNELTENDASLSDNTQPTEVAEVAVVQAAGETVCHVYNQNDLYGFADSVTTFSRSVFRSRILSTVELLHRVQRRCLDVMIQSTFDVATDIELTPGRLKYAREKEVGLLLVAVLPFLIQSVFHPGNSHNTVMIFSRSGKS